MENNKKYSVCEQTTFLTAIHTHTHTRARFVNKTKEI